MHTQRIRLYLIICLLLVALAACQGAAGDVPTAAAPTSTTAPLQTTPPPTAAASATSAPSATIPAATAAPTLAADLPTTAQYSYRVLNAYDHDPLAFTQGLVYLDGVLYEGTGLNGRSSLRRVDLETGEVLQMIELEEQYFGEGIVIWEDRIIQLTWQNNQGFVYDRESFALLDSFTYPTEGWGITHDGQQLIMSDGTANLYFWDPETLAETGRITVQDATGPIVRLNELEYIDGAVWANIWQTNRIAIIDPTTGWVNGWIDMSGILAGVEITSSIDVLNGIAHDPATGRIWITGKLWPKIFEIELVAE
ncbi:MAG: glutaminyl-peptide cyclotransferase [Anaerolineales bacterium]|nr:glutaminyl-peptide cyclotransferase [Anaerolineales bacterium]